MLCTRVHQGATQAQKKTEANMASIEGKMANMEGKMANVEGKIEGVETNVASMEGKIEGIVTKMDQLVDMVGQLSVAIREVGQTDVVSEQFVTTRAIRVPSNRQAAPAAIDDGGEVFAGFNDAGASF